MRLLLIMILWTWALTPLWLNIVGTVLLGLGMIGGLFKGVLELAHILED